MPLVPLRGTGWGWGGTSLLEKKLSHCLQRVGPGRRAATSFTDVPGALERALLQNMTSIWGQRGVAWVPRTRVAEAWVLGGGR